MSQKLSHNKLPLLLALVAIFTLPALNNLHYDPQPQFWAEISVAWAIIASFIWLLLTSTSLNIPAISLPLSAFALYLSTQPWLLHIDFPGLNYIAALEMLLGVFLAISINTWQQLYGRQVLVGYLCLALLIGGILQSAIGFIQYSNTYSYFGSLIFFDSAHPTTNIFGHFGQRNHYAHYLSWSCLALVYIYQQRRIPGWLFSLLLAWLAFSLTLSASRSVIFYFSAAVIISSGYHWLKRSNDSQRLWRLLLCTCLTLILFEYFYPILHHLISSQHNFSSGLGRLDSQGGTGRRGVEWAKAWLVFKAHPLWGLGWNEYAQQSVALHPLFPNAELNSGLFTNCHNLILQLLAECGVVGTIIVLSGIIWSLCRTYAAAFNSETLILTTMLATTLIHSLDEYPLWYLYFLAGLITFLATDPPLFKLKRRQAISLFILPVLGFSILMLRGSWIFDTLVDYSDVPDTPQAFKHQADYLQQLVAQNGLLAYHASYTLDNYINVDTPLTNNLFTLNQQYQATKRLASFHPYPDTLIKQAMLAWNLGHRRAAQQLVISAVIAFPVYNASFRDTLKAQRYQALRALVPVTKAE